MLSITYRKTEMKAMNKKAVNRAAAFLECLEDEERFASLVSLLSLETAGWDNPKETADTKRFLQAAEEGAEGLHKIKDKSASEVATLLAGSADK